MDIINFVDSVSLVSIINC